MKKTPICYVGSPMIQTQHEKWLGDVIHSGGEQPSIDATIGDRKPKVMNSIRESISIIEDTRMNKLGGVQCALDIWEMSIIPSLLNNADTWSALKEDHLSQLENVQLYFLRSLLAVPKSTPKPALYLDSDTMLMKFTIKQILT